MMLPRGEFRGVKYSTSEWEEIVRIKNGYVRILWKESELVEGVVLILDSKIVGSYVQYVMSKNEYFGDPAFEKIRDVIQNNKLRSIEFYYIPPKTISEFLNSHKEVQCTEVLTTSIQAIKDEVELLGYISRHEGAVLIENTKSQWLIEINKGRVTKAVEYMNNGTSRVGDNALKSLVKELPGLVDHLDIRMKPMNRPLSPNAKVKSQYLLKEVLELLIMKRSLEIRAG